MTRPQAPATTRANPTPEPATGGNGTGAGTRVRKPGRQAPDGAQRPGPTQPVARAIARLAALVPQRKPRSPPTGKPPRRRGARPVGGKIGHRGGTLRQAPQPDLVVEHAPARCPACNAQPARTRRASVFDTRQVFDLEGLRMAVTEHRLLQARCACGQLLRGQYPAQVGATVQYGPRALAAAVLLNQHHQVGLKNSVALLSEHLALSLSETIIVQTTAQAARLLTPVVQAIAQAIARQPLVHVDLAPMRMNAQNQWLHLFASEHLVWMARHSERGARAFADWGLPAHWPARLAHDRWPGWPGGGALPAQQQAGAQAPAARAPLPGGRLAERALHRSASKELQPLCWRSDVGADAYCTLASYLATMEKQGADLFDALTQTFAGAAPQPRLD